MVIRRRLIECIFFLFLCDTVTCVQEKEGAREHQTAEFLSPSVLSLAHPFFH